MTRTVEELSGQVSRLRGYMGHFKNRMEACIATLQRTQRDLEAITKSEDKVEVDRTAGVAIERIKAVVSAPPGVRLDVEAVEASPELLDAHALVCYFPTALDKDEFVALMKEAKPGMRAVDINK